MFLVKISNEKSDFEEVHFMRKLKKGSGKYTSKLSFKCFNCGKVRQFAAKCPYAKSEDSNYGSPDSTIRSITEKRRSLRNSKSLYQKEKVVHPMLVMKSP